jgi:RNA polymerase sigma-70 factor (ECF subfamily)
LDHEASPELIARARDDRSAFGELYDLYLPRVYAFCLLHTGTHEEAEDLTGDTFERALAAITRYEERGVPFSRWLLRIAHNMVLNHARRQGRRTGLDQPEVVPDLDGHMEDWSEAHWLHGHIRQLPPDQQQVVRLRFYDDHRFSEVAQRMGRSEGAVKQLLRRALRGLHLQIQAEEESA